MSAAEQAHLPTFGVNISNTDIRTICSTVCPERSLQEIAELPAGQSFNNRIYFIRYAHGAVDSSSTQYEHVLKLSGRFWGPEKIENEAACLLLLEVYCPDLPSPRVIAYSGGDGPILVAVRTNGSHSPPRLDQVVDLRPANGQSHPWLLMTRCPGERLDIADLEGPHGDGILRELAQCLAKWRHQIPPGHVYGNVRFSSGQYWSPPTFSTLPIAQVCGLLQSRSHKTTYVSSSQEYYNLCILDQLERRATNSIFATGEHDDTASLVQQMMRDSLPRLRLFKRIPQQAVFTHNDLSPRNILISRSDGRTTPTITGIVDFEFAGFFPYEEEFTNNAVHGRDDWPESTDEIFMTALEESGVLTPLSGIDSDAWGEAKTLVTVIANIAPWWLAEGAIVGDELKEELLKADKVVKEGIGKLRTGLEN